MRGKRRHGSSKQAQEREVKNREKAEQLAGSSFLRVLSVVGRERGQG